MDCLSNWNVKSKEPMHYKAIVAQQIIGPVAAYGALALFDNLEGI